MWIYAEGVGKGIVGKDGKPNMVVAIARDITQQRKSEIEKAKLYEEAQKAIALRDEFISLASHELKTPVTSLKAYLQVLRKQLEKKGDREVSVQLLKMDNQVNKLTELIVELLDLSKLQSGVLAYHKERFEIDELIRETIESTQKTGRKVQHYIFFMSRKRKYSRTVNGFDKFLKTSSLMR